VSSVGAFTVLVLAVAGERVAELVRVEGNSLEELIRKPIPQPA